jgi:hypothetical protein
MVFQTSKVFVRKQVPCDRFGEDVGPFSLAPPNGRRWHRKNCPWGLGGPLSSRYVQGEHLRGRPLASSVPQSLLKVTAKG